MKKIFKVFFSFFLLSFFPLVADIGYQQGYALSQDDLLEGYNLSLLESKSKDTNISLGASFIFWAPVEEGTAFSIYDETNVNKVAGRVNHVDDPYQPGFKIFGFVEAGADSDQTLVEYIHHHSTQYGRAQGPPAGLGYLKPLWLTDGGNVTYAKGKFKVHYDRINCMFGRNAFFGKRLLIKPSFGLSYFFIKQKFTARYTIDNTDIFSYNSSTAWAIGPRGGVFFDFNILKYCSIIGFGHTSLVFQDLRSETKQQDKDNYPSYLVKARENPYQVTPDVDLSTGIKISNLLSDDAFGFDFLVTYDFTYIWNQNVMREIKDFRSTLQNERRGNLMFHGLTLSFGLEF
ncbi:MAG TPA: Lpg1974 family pore-forming outer membrane protein [Chlamydiales bacterium]|nr:Lpg1974 family pore-forming outer membrane protein [Chlamydiales bacterium]